VTWLWMALGIVTAIALVAMVVFLLFHRYVKRTYFDLVVRIFEERPLFIIPRGQPVPDAEDIRLTTADGLSLCACYLKARTRQRQGVILFGLEFGSNRWSCVPYCDFLRDHGFDVFAFEPRNQGDSDCQPGYDPMQWVTDREIADFDAALDYLQKRSDADPRGVGLFGISKGGSAGLIAASRQSYVRCFVTDGIFATHTTMVPYMRKWVTIYSPTLWLHKLLSGWYFAFLAKRVVHSIRRQRGCRFPHLEDVMHRLAPRPLFMIHGGADTYIKPEMAQALFDRARSPKELWVVNGAKHNQALHVASGEYRQRVLGFFQQHLAVGDREDEEPEPDRLTLTEDKTAPSALAGPERERRATVAGASS
jgi:pimeloyl-ACP methyl ester carboxylesterase